MTRPRPLSDRQISSRMVYAVVDPDGNIDANLIYRPENIDHAIDLAKALSKEKGTTYLVIPIILK